MPIYRIRCDVCESEDDIFRSLKDYDNLPECCGQKMHRKVMPAMVTADIQPYRSMITGEMITSRSQHRTHLKDHGCLEIGNETKHLKGITLEPSPESHKRRKEMLIQKVQQLTA
jgi:hypothetical protein